MRSATEPSFFRRLRITTSTVLLPPSYLVPQTSRSNSARDTGAGSNSRWAGDRPPGAQPLAGALVPRTHTNPGADPHGRKAHPDPHPDSYPDPNGGAPEEALRNPVPQPLPDPARR